MKNASDVFDELLGKWQYVADLMAEVVGVPAGLIMRKDGNHIQVLVSSRTAGNPYHSGDVEPLLNSYCEDVLNGMHALLVPNAIVSERWRHNRDVKLNMISYLGFPIRWPDQTPFGTICVLDCKTNAYSDRYMDLIKMFRDLIEAHLQVAHAESIAERERQIVSFLLGDFEENASDWLWETDSQGYITRAGPHMAEAIGKKGVDLVGILLPSLFSQARLLAVPSDGPVGSQALSDHLQAGVSFDGLIVEAMIAGEQCSWRIAACPLQLRKGTGDGWRGVGSSVSASRAREAEGLNREASLYHAATHDELTGLPNRRALTERLDALVQNGHSEENHIGAFLLIDLDNFKTVNDALGHDTGDIMLSRVADRLRQALEPADFLARLGGDEFAVLISMVPAEQAADTLKVRALRIIDLLREPEEIERFRVDLRGSIGAVLVSDGLPSSSELMSQADIALYAAKSEGRDRYKIYANSMGAHVKARLSMVSDLAQAIERDELSMLYQCIVDVATLRVSTCEALMRWSHPCHGIIAAANFIPVAEECGLIVPIGLWALEQACRTATNWPENIRIAVNVSAVQLNSYSFVQSVLECIKKTGLKPERLELEITESSVVSDNISARLALNELRQAGIHIVLDDFGTGYSSMVQVRELPIDKLKLDRSFVVGLNGERAEASRSIISSLLHLSSLMNLNVTAEGIETAAEFKVLRELGCPSAQGYLFCRPMKATEIEEALQTDYTSIVNVT